MSKKFWLGLITAVATAAVGGLITAIIPAYFQEKPNEVNLELSHKADLISTIQLASNLQAQASKQLDPAILHRVFTGTELKNELLALEALRDRGEFASCVSRKREFLSFKVLAKPLRAEVKMKEDWFCDVFSSSSQECLKRVGQNGEVQTFFLESNDDDWMIYAIERHNSSPSQTPCAGSSA